jgi:2-amino-4-hydroxy-6-hydroxymethyldihydropteridine diphosphokinase
MNQIFLLLGSNLGNKRAVLEQTANIIGFRVGKIFASSSFFETEPWGNADQPSFVNQVIGVTSLLGAKDLLDVCKKIEKEMGRESNEKWGPRLIDIDILFFGNDIIESDALSIPHPQLHLRRFTLEPLHEIASELVHPIFKKTISELLLECTDRSEVHKLTRDEL